MIGIMHTTDAAHTAINASLHTQCPPSPSRIKPTAESFFIV